MVKVHGDMNITRPHSSSVMKTDNYKWDVIDFKNFLFDWFVYTFRFFEQIDWTVNINQFDRNSKTNNRIRKKMKLSELE